MINLLDFVFQAEILKDKKQAILQEKFLIMNCHYLLNKYIYKIF